MSPTTQPAALLIDERSASISASDSDLREWVNGRRIFVSSLIGDMPAERAAVREVLERIGAEPVMFEHDLGAQDVSAEQAYLAGVRSSEIYVGIWGPRYGVKLADGYAATHAEFKEAERGGLRILLYVGAASLGAMDGEQRDLVDGARNLYTSAPYASPEDLADRLERRLRQLCGEEKEPWVRVGRTVFRVREITDDGQKVGIRGTVRDEVVHAELVRMRDSYGGDVLLALPNDARDARMLTLSTSTIAAGRHDEHLQLQTRGRPSRMAFATPGMTADEIAKKALEDGLFNRRTPDPRVSSHAVLLPPADPLAPVRGRGLSDDILRPVVRLLIIEYLYRSGMAKAITSFALGPAHQGRRRLRFSWIPPNPYTNMPDPAPMEIDDIIGGL